MTSCVAHEKTSTEVQCASCGKAICGECIAPGSETPRCFDCAINDAGEAVDHDVLESRKRVAEVTRPPKPKLVSGWVKAMAVFGGLIIVLQVAIIFLLAKPAATAQGAAVTPGEQESGAAAVAQTILLSQGLEQYRDAHGKYPETLDALAAEMPPELVPLLTSDSIRYQKSALGGYQIRQTTAGSSGPLVYDSTAGTLQVEESR